MALVGTDLLKIIQHDIGLLGNSHQSLKKYNIMIIINEIKNTLGVTRLGVNIDMSILRILKSLHSLQ